MSMLRSLVKLLITRFTGISFTVKPIELNDAEHAIIDYVVENRLSMGSREALYGTLLACKHVMDSGVPGDFVECGVWRGGNAMIAAMMFDLYEEDRKCFLFDTFTGMTAPTADDFTNSDHKAAYIEFTKRQKVEHNDWCYASLEDVKNVFEQKPQLSNIIRLVKGDVADTLRRKENLPTNIAVLRLDTDWYESTKLELEILYPKLEKGGVLIIDDYGHWAGSKKATDEYFSNGPKRPFLQYTNVTVRMAVKTD
jgi:O-methyltransferase